MNYDISNWLHFVCVEDTSLNRLKILGLLADGFGSTSAMRAKDLIWVVCWSHVEVDYYAS